jgi:hypothetical protein
MIDVVVVAALFGILALVAIADHKIKKWGCEED